MKSIGILTFHRAINYGAILQGYALQQALLSLGIENEIIDYNCKKIENEYRIKKFNECENFKEIIKYIIFTNAKKQKANKFNEFINKKMIISKRYDSSNIIDCNEYEKFLVGSDQVWNHRITNFDKTYFLDFVKDNSKKNSYAASLGFCEMPIEKRQDYKNLLMNFNNLSVRESQSELILKNLLNRKIEINLDPTFLLCSEDWERLISTKKIKQDYILVYSISDSEELIKFSKALSLKTKCKIILIEHPKPFQYIGIKKEKVAGPLEFLSLFSNAKYVVTSTFHGVCYSIIFKKNFYVMLKKSVQNNNSRINNLLDMLKLKDRIIDKDIKINENIDYSYATNILEEERKKSFEYLKRVTDNE